MVNKTARFVQSEPYKDKRRPLYLKPQSVPRCKHFFFNPLKTSADRFT